MSKQKEHRSDLLDDFIWGINTVTEALEHKGQSINEVTILKGKGGQKVQHIIDLARQGKIKLKFVESSRFGVPKSVNHQGVVARLSPAPMGNMDDLLEYLELHEGADSRILVLDSIQDPRNVGSIIRSALAAGFKHILLTRERSAPVSGTVAKTSAGALSHVHLYQAVNLAEALQQLKERGLWVFGTVVGGDGVTSIYETDFSRSVCLVVGNEEKGIRPLVKKQCDVLVTIPMADAFNSLNVSAAATVVMFEIRRQILLDQK